MNNAIERNYETLIQYLRHLEKKNKGDGLIELDRMKDEFLSDNVYNAVKPLIEEPERYYELTFIHNEELERRREKLQKMFDDNFYTTFIKPTIKDER